MEHDLAREVATALSEAKKSMDKLFDRLGRAFDGAPDGSIRELCEILEDVSEMCEGFDRQAADLRDEKLPLGF